MSIFDGSRLAFVAVLALTSGMAVAADPGPELGEPVGPEDIANWDISIAPDGSTLPPGGGDAAGGKAVYEERCLRCHGEDGEGGDGLADPLVGGIGSLASAAPKKTVGSYWPYATTVFDYIRRAMPYDRPMSLSDSDVYAVTAYVLSLNGIIEDGAVMDAGTLPAVKMPNRDGFVLYWPEAD